MCGIAGLMSRDGAAPAQATVEAMGVALAHRGPDGIGHYGVGDVAMIHRRLAVIDLETGDQPLYEPGGAALIANAEVYNYLELRDGMGGVAFATHSDCEPPLHVYRRHGVAFAGHLRGTYSIVVLDAKTPDRLVVARQCWIMTWMANWMFSLPVAGNTRTRRYSDCPPPCIAMLTDLPLVQ